MTAATLTVANSYAALAPDSSNGRPPRAPRRQRPAEFHQVFDAKTQFYDCFWHGDGRRILLVGPPPCGIDYAHARFTARPSGTSLKARLHPSLSVMLTELTGAPADTTAIDAEIAGKHVLLPVQPNDCKVLAGSRLLFSINKNNDLAWIREWAEFHARVHGTDAVILVDNGSPRYTADDVRATLAEVPGIRQVGVPSWPYSFGPKDPAVVKDDHWARFLQISSMSMVLRRYGERAFGLLNCDVDELVGTRSGASIYDLARQSKGGLVVFRGTWIEATGQGARHRDYTRRLADPEAARSRQRKWALDPSRSWVRRLSVHPYWHWIEGRALFAKSMPPDALYWHFRGINTNWKQKRTAPPSAQVGEDDLLVQRFTRLEQGT